MKRKTKLLAAGAFAALALFAALPTVFLQDKNQENSVVDAPVEEMLAVDAAILRQGARGSEVKEVQRRLKQWGYYNGSVDGVFGKNTRSAVILFQRKNGLTADGVVGKETYKALGMNDAYQALQNSVPSQTGVNGFSQSDVYLLAKTIYAEGRGEPYSGQVAIGKKSVRANRIHRYFTFENPEI